MIYLLIGSGNRIGESVLLFERLCWEEGYILMSGREEQLQWVFAISDHLIS